MKKIVLLFVASFFCLFYTAKAQAPALVVLEVTETSVKLGLETQNTEDTFYGNLKCASVDSLEFYMEGAALFPNERFILLQGLTPGTQYTALLSGTLNGVDWFETSSVLFSTTGSVSIDEQKNEALFNLFPNPTTDFISVAGLKPSDASIRIISLDGKILLETKVVSDQVVTLDVQHLVPGTYVVQTGTKSMLVVKN